MKTVSTASTSDTYYLPFSQATYPIIGRVAADDNLPWGTISHGPLSPGSVSFMENVDTALPLHYNQARYEHVQGTSSPIDGVSASARFETTWTEVRGWNGEKDSS